MSGVKSLVSSTKIYKLFQEKYFSPFHFILPYAGYEVFLISGPECNNAKPPMSLRLVKTSLNYNLVPSLLPKISGVFRLNSSGNLLVFIT